ncbi:RNA ligase and tail fiber protein attachment catalyst [Proteus phage phiP4-3]|uniref:RNA ligase 1 n=1 Tax=Proteus phage phiP4-3 TaxID=2065203 RepID=A0A2I6PF99_9CAUD|nr:RNA ligase and tail fiber protein attachment catalyst [Proteus phage phiP4-3]AUM58399.1 RNA ligase 1 and tail fiber attachment catalyst [Proteus phage phiP4-3]QQV89500.1 RNA ligase 1 and tail fiber attachment catalyst [Proteus phage SJ_PmiM]
MKLFDNLMALCEYDRTKFFYNDVNLSIDKKGRIFNYNYASYSDWLLPDALECRGIMFELDKDNNPVKVLSRPMEKFFNLNENPMTMDLDLSKVEYLMDKADGSLISSYLVDGFVYLKSKGSISSEQALEACKLINSEMYSEVRKVIKDNPEYTFNFEYVAPTNRIVLKYSEPALILLNARHNETGEYIDYDSLKAIKELRPILVTRYEPEEGWVERVYESQGIEGVVAQMSDGTKFKVKSHAYVSLHRTKDSITSNEDLFKAIVEGTSDDLKSLFANDQESLEKIKAFEEVYTQAIHDQVESVKMVYEANLGKDRKDYAINGQTEFNKAGVPQVFSAYMKMYNGFDYDVLLSCLNDLFVKYYTFFIPEVYKK